LKKGFKRFEELVNALETLPTIGKKSAMRLAFYMVMEDSFSALKIAHTIENAVREIRKCKRCGGISEDELCNICVDEQRDSAILCIVENAKDILAIEESGEFNGKYFVLDSLEENIENLKNLVKEESIKEILFALTPSIANDAVIIYIEDRLKDFDIIFTKIAQGVPTGVNLENVDSLSLSRALKDRKEV